MSNFRVQAKNLFLTYPQCPIPKQEALQQLLAKLQLWQPELALVASEFHADGHQHLHAAIQLNRKCNITNAHLLDLNWESANEPLDRIYHGNYQAVRS